MLVEQAIHDLDLWLWLYGPAATVYGFTSHVPLGGTYPPAEEAVENKRRADCAFQERWCRYDD